MIILIKKYTDKVDIYTRQSSGVCMTEVSKLLLNILNRESKSYCPDIGENYTALTNGLNGDALLNKGDETSFEKKQQKAETQNQLPIDIDKKPPKTIQLKNLNEYKKDLLQKYPNCTLSQDGKELNGSNNSGEHISISNKDNEYTFIYTKNKGADVVYNKYDNKGQLTNSDIKKNNKSKFFIIYDKGKLLSESYVDDSGNKTKKELEYYKNGRVKTNQTIKNEQVITSHFTKNGELDYVENENGEKSYPIVDDIYNDLRAKNAFGLPSTGKKLKENLAKITPENVNRIYRNYEERTGQATLIEDIMTEVNLPYKEREGYINEIKSKIMQSAKMKGVMVYDLVEDYEIKQKDISRTEILPHTNNDDLLAAVIERVESKGRENKTLIKANGKIDENFTQGQRGDCWFLACIDSLSRSEKGKEILNNSLKADSKGNVTVTLQGVGKSYFVSAKELQEKGELANGDGDVRAIEIACSRYLNDNKDSLDGNFMNYGYQLLTGKGQKSKIKMFTESVYSKFFDISDSNLEKLKKDNIVGTVCIAVQGNSYDKKEIENEDGNILEFITNHAYSIKEVKDNNVVLVNPHNTAEDITLSMKEFKSTFNNLDLVEL